jgi:hypothetical protein
MIKLTKDQEAHIRAAAGDLNTAEVQNFRAQVIARLQKFVEGGGVHAITTPHVLAACTAEQVSE